jgi:hypothetical protein
MPEVRMRQHYRDDTKFGFTLLSDISRELAAYGWDEKTWGQMTELAKANEGFNNEDRGNLRRIAGALERLEGLACSVVEATLATPIERHAAEPWFSKEAQAAVMAGLAKMEKTLGPCPKLARRQFENAAWWAGQADELSYNSAGAVQPNPERDVSCRLHAAHNKIMAMTKRAKTKKQYIAWRKLED